MVTKQLILSCVCVLGMSFPALADEPVGPGDAPFALMPKYLSDAPAAKPDAPPAAAGGSDADLAAKLSNPRGCPHQRAVSVQLRQPDRAEG